jgi:sec-independent protein translocase protein TatC
VGIPFRRGSGRRRFSRRNNPDGTMTLIEHLYELRHRLTIAIIAVLAFGVVGFLWFQFRLFGLPTLGTLLTDPYCSLPSNLRADISQGDKCQLLATAPFEAFMLQLKVGLSAGMVLASPVWLYQLWGFITPGLYEKERRYALTFVAVAAVLFVAGAMLAYFVVAQGLEVLLGFGGGQVVTALTGDRYFSFILAMLLIFGVSFELPVLVVMLNRAGVVSYAKLRSWLRGIIMGLFVFAAVATPSQDPISMLALAVALTLLFAGSLVICRMHDRSVARRRAEEGWDESLSDDEASSMDSYQVEPVEQAEPVGRYDDAT